MKNHRFRKSRLATRDNLSKDKKKKSRNQCLFKDLSLKKGYSQWQGQDLPELKDLKWLKHPVLRAVIHMFQNVSTIYFRNMVSLLLKVWLKNHYPRISSVPKADQGLALLALKSQKLKSLNLYSFRKRRKRRKNLIAFLQGFFLN